MPRLEFLTCLKVVSPKVPNGLKPKASLRIVKGILKRKRAKIFVSRLLEPGAGENTLRRLAHFLCYDHPTKSDVTSGKKATRGEKFFFDAAVAFSR